MRTVHLLRKLDADEWGGTETAIVRLFEGLRENGIDAVAYCPRLNAFRSRRREEAGRAPSLNGPPPHVGGYDEAPLPLPVRRFRAFVPVIGISRERRRQLVSVGGNLMSFDLIPSLWREKNTDIIHTHVLGRLGGAARVVARRRRIPFVVSIHGGAMDLPEKTRQNLQAARAQGWEWGRPFGWIFGARRSEE